MREMKQSKKGLLLFAFQLEQLRGWLWLKLLFFVSKISCLPALMTPCKKTSKSYENEITHHTLIDDKVVL